MHRVLNVVPERLRDVLCKRELRCVSQQLSFCCERRQFMLNKNHMSIALIGKICRYPPVPVRQRRRSVVVMLPALHDFRQGAARHTHRDHREQAPR
jgi:hypothetical protein